MSKPTAKAAAVRPKSLGRRMAESRQLCILLLVPILLTVICKYIPMYGIRIAGNDLPDAFMGVGFSNPDIAEYGEDGTFIDLIPYITAEVMPNLTKILEEHPEIRSAITISDGKTAARPVPGGRFSRRFCSSYRKHDRLCRDCSFF